MHSNRRLLMLRMYRPLNMGFNGKSCEGRSSLAPLRVSPYETLMSSIANWIIKRHPSFGVFGVRRASIFVKRLLVLVSGRIEHCDQCRLCMNAGFCHGTLTLGADRVDGATQI